MTRYIVLIIFFIGPGSFVQAQNLMDDINEIIQAHIRKPLCMIKIDMEIYGVGRSDLLMERKTCYFIKENKNFVIEIGEAYSSMRLDSFLLTIDHETKVIEYGKIQKSNDYIPALNPERFAIQATANGEISLKEDNPTNRTYSIVYHKGIYDKCYLKIDRKSNRFKEIVYFYNNEFESNISSVQLKYQYQNHDLERIKVYTSLSSYIHIEPDGVSVASDYQGYRVIERN